MLKICFLLVACAALAAAAASCHTPGSTSSRPGVLRHVVLFKFKDSATEDDVRALERAFAALPGEIDAIEDFEWGTDNSPEGLADGFTHCFLVTFRDAAGRGEYLPHPAHQRFVAQLRPHLDKVCVVDYDARR